MARAAVAVTFRGRRRLFTCSVPERAIAVATIRGRGCWFRCQYLPVGCGEHDDLVK
jgi:hypothetical protein